MSAGDAGPQHIFVGEESAGQSCGQARPARPVTRKVEKGSQVAVAPQSPQLKEKGWKGTEKWNASPLNGSWEQLALTANELSARDTLQDVPSSLSPITATPSSLPKALSVEGPEAIIKMQVSTPSNTTSATVPFQITEFKYCICGERDFTYEMGHMRIYAWKKLFQYHPTQIPP